MQSRKEYLKKYRLENKEKIKSYYRTHKDRLSEYRKEHYTGLYGSWYAMKQRCDNPNNINYKNYGGRGITYPDDWKTFKGFSKDMQQRYRHGLTIERKDVNGNYSRDNCIWATRKTQNNNKRKHTLISYQGQIKSIAQWSEYLEINYHTLLSRYLRKWPTDRIMNPELERPVKLLIKV